MIDFTAATFVQSSCCSVWRWETLSGDGVVRGVSCVTGNKGSGLSGGSAIDLVSVVKNEPAPLKFYWQVYLHILAVKLFVANIVQRVLLVFPS